MRCVVCREPYYAGSTGGHWRTGSPPPADFFRGRGLGRIPISPALTGTWPWGNDFPPVVELTDVAGVTHTFALARLAWPAPICNGVQYREAVDHDSLHLIVYPDGSWMADHRDESNPDVPGQFLEHVVKDNGQALLLGMAVAGFGLGLVGGLLLLRS